jgi:quercetin dioxygenase-like cupin family protein
MDPHALVIHPAHGLSVPPLGMVRKIGAGHLDGRMLIMEGVVGPGQLIVPHTHTREDECAYLLSGTLTYQIGDQVADVSAGAYVVKPRGIPHAFWNAGGEPARVLEIHLPATFDRFYDELAALFTIHEPGGRAWRQAFDALNDRYGLVQHWDLAEQITARYGVGAQRS